MINRLSSTVLKGSSFMNYNFMFYKAINVIQLKFNINSALHHRVSNPF